MANAQQTDIVNQINATRAAIINVKTQLNMLQKSGGSPQVNRQIAALSNRFSVLNTQLTNLIAMYNALFKNRVANTDIKNLDVITPCHTLGCETHT